MKTQLLCTFLNKKEIDSVTEEIVNNYSITNNKIYVYDNLSNRRECICVYNVVSDKIFDHLKNTISIHRKKETNTLYTINALNLLIREANNGMLDKSFEINWTVHRDKLLLLNGNEIKEITIRFKNFIKLIEKR